MKTLAATTVFIGGLLLILVPRYILPACEYEGYPPMHCSDTARAEYIAGAALIAIGVVTFFFKKRSLVVLSTVVSCIVYGISFWLPDKFGYCLSPRMPCNYGMVPGVRFIAAAGIIILIGTLIGVARQRRKKGNP